ncbi:hypothetical protein Q8W38_15405 [Vibrio splendidus]|uniref:Phospholipase D-like domain-containing protein n=1 Tax=Vibrio splendidus TaxID=29497 RepID=A0ABD5ACS8_VIBSP|nr:hypothetical protein [Vibrio splendidus]MDP2490737.1 hypothetical protein [Vibrio splendidus]PMO48579.1 hypothetical protein BCT08_24205 [Vibrio splendidus]
MNQFISNSSSITAKQAILNTVSEDGNFLILGYGSFGGSGGKLSLDNTELIDTITCALKKNPKLKVELHVGVMFHYSNKRNKKNKSKLQQQVVSEKIRDKRYFEAFKSEVSDFLGRFDLALYKDWKGTNFQVDLFLVPDFHSKFCLMSNNPHFTAEPQDELVLPPVSGVMGSSNFTSAAFDESRFELDLYMTGGAENTLLLDFSKTVASMLTSNKQRAVLKCDLVKRAASIEENSGLSRHLTSVTYWQEFRSNFFEGQPLSHSTYDAAAFGTLDEQAANEVKGGIEAGSSQD